jgi:thioredoxin reductase
VQEVNVEMAIIGGGPAGCAAAIQAHTLGISSAIVESGRLGGQLWNIAHISNLPGGPSNGPTLAQALAEQIRMAGTQVIMASATTVLIQNSKWHVLCDSDITIIADSIIAATGTREMYLREHPLIEDVNADFTDTFIYDVPVSRFRAEESVIIGCDRTLITLIDANPEIANAPITVLALPDKFYVLRDQLGSFPLRLIPLSKILKIRSDKQTAIEAVGINGIPVNLETNLALSNLGKVPSSQLFTNLLSHDQDGYLSVEQYPHRGNKRIIYPVGDVAHKAFQRISVALGEGTRAALDYFYSREGLYGYAAIDSGTKISNKDSEGPRDKV